MELTLPCCLPLCHRLLTCESIPMTTVSWQGATVHSMSVGKTVSVRPAAAIRWRSTSRSWNGTTSWRPGSSTQTTALGGAPMLMRRSRRDFPSCSRHSPIPTVLSPLLDSAVHPPDSRPWIWSITLMERSLKSFFPTWWLIAVAVCNKLVMLWHEELLLCLALLTVLTLLPPFELYKPR